MIFVTQHVVDFLVDRFVPSLEDWASDVGQHHLPRLVNGAREVKELALVVLAAASVSPLPKSLPSMTPVRFLTLQVEELYACQEANKRYSNRMRIVAQKDDFLPMGMAILETSIICSRSKIIMVGK